MGQAKNRGTYAERVKQAQSKSVKYDILLRIYDRYDDPESKCGTIRVKTDSIKANQAIKELSNHSKNDLSGCLAWALAKHKLNGEAVINDPELAPFGNVFVAYLSRYDSWPLVTLTAGNNMNLLVDFNNQSQKGPGMFNFCLRGNQGGSEAFDLFEQKRTAFWPTHYGMHTLGELPNMFSTNSEIRG